MSGPSLCKAALHSIGQHSMPTHISVWGYMYPLVFPFGGTCSFLRVHIF